MDGAILRPVAPDITSPANDRIKWLTRLRDRRHRDAEGLFVVEGKRLYRRALEAGLVPEITFLADETLAETVGKTITVDPGALDKASYRRESQGVIGVFPQLDTRLDHLHLAEPPLILIAENVEKPGNLGAMLRTAAAAGADALITVGEALDAHNPNVVRASTGALFTVPLAMSNWDELAPWLDDNDIRVICAAPDASDPVWEAHLTGPLAIVVGAEDLGLSDAALALADCTVLIPQDTGIVDSLNVSVAAAILLFEARRQRA
ncbi:MAG TPA: RNA methyltransferase [Acidimicrobiia bacterium]